MRRLLLFIVLPLTIATLGCGPGYSTAEVSGKVTFKGEPLADASVNFTPVGGDKGMGSFGKTDASGNYSLELIDGGAAGAAVGEHSVTVTIASDEEQDVIDPATTKVPLKYRDGSQKFTVPAEGTDSANFDI